LLNVSLKSDKVTIFGNVAVGGWVRVRVEKRVDLVKRFLVVSEGPQALHGIVIAIRRRIYKRKGKGKGKRWKEEEQGGRKRGGREEEGGGGGDDEIARGRRRTGGDRNSRSECIIIHNMVTYDTERRAQ